MSANTTEDEDNDVEGDNDDDQQDQESAESSNSEEGLTSPVNRTSVDTQIEMGVSSKMTQTLKERKGRRTMPSISTNDDNPSTDVENDMQFTDSRRRGNTVHFRNPGRGINRICRLSDRLAALVGASELPRHEVVKRVWAIIKRKNLYDPRNRQFAICDSQLRRVFGVKRFRIFSMLKYLKQHFQPL